MNDVTFAALIGTIVGGKLYFAINETIAGRDFVSALFSRAGFVYWGGFLGSVLLSWLVIRWRKQPFLRIADGAAVGIAAGYAIGRTGCWAVGDDYGRPYSGPLAVSFPQGAPPSTVYEMQKTFHVQFPLATDPSTVVSVYPTQLIEVLLGFVMFAILWKLRDHDHAEGWLFGVWAVLAGIERFIIEFFRAKDDRFDWAFGLSMAQVIAVAMVLIGIAVMAARSRTGPDRPGVRAVPVAA
jgi:phosphatidylglycerol:prolipoprotein diacylglycerol transferase